MTDNKNRTVAEVRHAFTKRGGNLGTDGSVAYLFSKVGQLTFSAETDEDELLEAALEAGAEELITHTDSSKEIETAFEDYFEVKGDMIAAGFAPESSQITMKPSTTVELDKDGAEKIIALVDMLEDLDDVQNVYTNSDIPDDVLEQL